MADGFQIRTNLPDFRRQMQSFSADLTTRVIRAGVAAAATVFKKYVIELAPVLRKPQKGKIAGLLRRAIYVKRSRDSRSGLEHYFVGVRAGPRARKRKGGSLDAFYWRFVEAGHLIRRAGQALQGGKRRKALERRRQNAAGADRVPAYPFFEPAFQRGKDEALDAFNKRVQQRIDQANAK